MSGGLNPSPIQAGAAGGLPLEVIVEALQQDMGTAFSNDTDGYVYAESMAYARMLKYAWSVNSRLGNQWTAALMTDFLPRWEDILGLSHEGNAVDRRAKVAAKLLAFGTVPTYSAVRDLMTTVLGDCFVSLQHVPDGYWLGSIEGGETIPGGNTLSNDNFRTQGSYVGVEVSQPTDMTDLEFVSIIAQVGEFLDSFLPSWVEFAAIQLGGFILDTDNLDISSLESS